jgi:5-formyltetrahydrofolate cyclo-ligase
MIVPGVAFTESGHRLGHGRGYYDSYLERCLLHPQGPPFTLGLGFKQQIVSNIPCDDHDVKLDEVIFADEEIGSND